MSEIFKGKITNSEIFDSYTYVEKSEYFLIDLIGGERGAYYISKTLFIEFENSEDKEEFFDKNIRIVILLENFNDSEYIPGYSCLGGSKYSALVKNKKTNEIVILNNDHESESNAVNEAIQKMKTIKETSTPTHFSEEINMKIEIDGGVIKYAEYDKHTPSMKIHYQDGRSKSFHDVPESIALGLKQAEDKEDFYTKHVQPYDPEYRVWKENK